MSTSDESSPPRKLCFVTIGATAGFDALIRAVLSPPFLAALDENRYTDLRLQYGKDGRAIFEDFIQSRRSDSSEVSSGLHVSGFDFDKRGIEGEIKAVKGGVNGLEGVMVSHAGSGSILAALRIAVPLVVVPNPTLLDNHQVELAEALAEQGYVIHGHLNDLPAAILQSENLRRDQKGWPPDDKQADPSGKGLLGVMDDELGFVD